MRLNGRLVPHIGGILYQGLIEGWYPILVVFHTKGQWKAGTTYWWYFVLRVNGRLVSHIGGTLNQGLMEGWYPILVVFRTKGQWNV